MVGRSGFSLSTLIMPGPYACNKSNLNGVEVLPDHLCIQHMFSDQTSSLKFSEGKIPFYLGGEVFETYYKFFGPDIDASILSIAQGPLVVLHGSGMSHDYLTTLADLAPSTTVIFYDQLGSGQSSRLLWKDSSFWTIDLFIAQLENVLYFFGISHCFNLLGHCWGGVLASEFIARRQPKGLQSLVLSNTPASSKLRNELLAAQRLKLPERVQGTLKKHEAAGTTKTEDYRTAMRVFWAKHGCRVQPFPPEFIYTQCVSEDVEDPRVLEAMNGNMRLDSEWDMTQTIIPSMRHVPTLLITADLTESASAPFFWGIDRMKCVQFPTPSHTPQWGERERYMTVVAEFLKQTGHERI
ncbi:Alpha/Beta hydrolase protein [Favolaschia claudopus]|uniref:Alpha/Beta hydrolase protein n=1 Tax=Favolaschia claudopus TaxID=2862362 RepID=A0AAW0B5T8_9AGAR